MGDSTDPTVRFNEDGSLDEVVGIGPFHLEQMADNHWWMQLGPHMVHLQARGKITAFFSENEARDDRAMAQCPHRGCTQTDGKPCAYAACPNRSQAADA